MKTRSFGLQITAVLLIACLGLPPGLLAAVAPELPNPGTVPGVSKQQQVQVGLKAMSEVYKQMPVLPDSNPVSQYVQQLGNKLTAVIPPQYSWPYQFHVIPEKEINAFALPGGPIFINLGTIAAARNEAELAGVLGHEMSHVYMQHSMKAAKKESVPSAVVGVLGGLLGAYGGALGSLASMGIQIGAGAVFMRYSRADEAQADAVGAIIMYKAGYDPKAMADFFKMLEQQGGSSGPQFLSDHPNPGNREAAIQKHIRNWPPEQWVEDSPQFEQAKDETKDIRAYTAKEIAQGAKQGIWARENARQGAIPAGSPSAGLDSGTVTPVSAQQIKPSSKYTQLQRPGFRISYPQNWQTFGNARSLTIAPRGGVSQSAVGYGVLINRYQVQRPDLPPDQATSELIATLKQDNPDLQVTGNPQDISINGVQGRSVDLRGLSPVQQNGAALPERDWLVTLPQGNNRLLYVVFVAPEPAFESLRPAFEKILHSLQMQ
jgi:Zn-dependent protease with chaperone function